MAVEIMRILKRESFYCSSCSLDAFHNSGVCSLYHAPFMGVLIALLCR